MESITKVIKASTIKAINESIRDLRHEIARGTLTNEVEDDLKLRIETLEKAREHLENFYILKSIMQVMQEK